MKVRYWILIIVIVYLLGGLTWGIIDYYAFPCKGTFVFNWEGPTETTIISTDPGCVSHKLEIIGRQRENKIDVQCSDGCKTGVRTMDIDIKPFLYKWTFLLSVPVGGMYSAGQGDMTIGIEPGFIRHFKNYGVGASLWYQQGILTSYKAAGVKANFSFSWGRQ